MESLALIRAIRGAPLTVLFALAVSNQPLGALQLATLTGYSDKTVIAALRTLQEFGMVQRHGRYNAWLPTHQVRQLFLGAEPEILRLPCSSSRDDPDTQDHLTQPLQPETRGTGNFTTPLPTEWQDLVTLLVERCAAPPTLAMRALAQAHAEDFYPEYIRYAILRWLAYCLSEHGRGIKNRGAFIASRIAHGLEPPEWFTTPKGDLGREIRRAQAAWENQA